MLPLLPLIQQLSPWIEADKFDLYLEDMVKNRYRMAVVYDGNTALGVAGIWVNTKLYSGKYMELDNVVIDINQRSKGVGKLLTEFLIKLAEKENCAMMMLDAYIKNEKGHQFYERLGFQKKGYHFLKILDENTSFKALE